ncbi:MAG: hypothetical protein R3A50_11010 [Saprospiraceae bacterium]
MNNKIKQQAPQNAIYGMGLIGALVYYLSIATSFWTGVICVLKAVFWPGFLVYEALKALGAS